MPSLSSLRASAGFTLGSADTGASSVRGRTRIAIYAIFGRKVIPPPPATPPPLATGAPEGRPWLTRRLRTTLVVVVLIVVIIIGIIGYAIAGFAYATARVASTDRVLNTVISHQNTLNTTFKNVDTEFSALGSSTTFNSAQASSVADEFVTSATKARTIVNQDDLSLAAASASLN